MYGGDDVGAIVVDVGSSFVRAGYAGEGNPKAVLPTIVGDMGAAKAETKAPVTVSAVAPMDVDADAPPIASASAPKYQRYHVGDAARYRRDDMEIIYPVQDGVVTDWTAMEEIFDYTLTKHLQVDPKEHPVMIADRAFDTDERRATLAELMFEKFDIPAMYLARSAVLAAFSVGKPTALVLDSGGGLTTVSPVHDGYVLHRHVRKTKVAGNFLESQVEKEFFGGERKNITVHPRYTIQREALPQGGFKISSLDFPRTRPSYYRMMQLSVIRDIKESLCRVTEQLVDSSTHVPVVPYELPDGKTLDIGVERFTVPEKLFAPVAADLPANDFEDQASFQGLASMVSDCVNDCDVDIRRDLYGTIVVTGGNTLFPGFPERLTRDLNVTAPPAMKAKTALPFTRLERKFGVWIGGSILASLGSFHQMWVSKAEYQEQGAALLAKKFP